ncbi:elongation factor 1-alpha C-terminal domain-related protein [Rhodoferax sp.]|uniref:elongation factor 1-alpha C-terminal domain-related protein n=1 Tax=Rhodoferax sp. TaxID=50421 RepID=UPI00274F0CD2|nr:hypothetical protein [Rhodoferax sp.]
MNEFSRIDDVADAQAARPEKADQFEARLLWTSEHPMSPGRQYLMKHDCREVMATITDMKYRQDTSAGPHLAAKTLMRSGACQATCRLIHAANR